MQLKSLMLSLLLVLFANFVFANKIYQIDSMHSFVEYNINHLGFSNPSGKWFVNGMINFDEAKISKSTVSVTIQLKNIVTGIEKLDKHLLSSEFFDANKYPIASFISTKVSRGHHKYFIIDGVLTLHGVAKPIKLKVRQNHQGINPITKMETVGFSATTTLKRSDFKMNNYIPMIGDVVNLNIQIEANPKNN